MKIFKYVIAVVSFLAGAYLAISMKPAPKPEPVAKAASAPVVAKELEPVFEVSPMIAEPTPEIAYAEPIVEPVMEQETMEEHASHSANSDAYDLYLDEMADLSEDDKILGVIVEAEYEPVYLDDGSFAGLQISALPDRDIFSSTSHNLQNGDVITQINDIEIVDENSFIVAVQQLHEVQQPTMITFNINRDNVPYSVSLEFNP